jgi:hypothetical protein
VDKGNGIPVEQPRYLFFRGEKIKDRNREECWNRFGQGVLFNRVLFIVAIDLEAVNVV